MDISGIEASAPHDSTLQTSIDTYTGMMNTAAAFRAGTLGEREMLAGQLAFITATTNNESVQVDFSSWVRLKSKSSLVLGNVTAAPAPTYVESVYTAVENSDGTIAVIISSPTEGLSVPSTLKRSSDELDEAYESYTNGALKPAPRRCAGALFLKAKRSEPIPAGKCDSGLTWTGVTSSGSAFWSSVAGHHRALQQLHATQPTGRLVQEGVQDRPQRDVHPHLELELRDRVQHTGERHRRPLHQQRGRQQGLRWQEDQLQLQQVVRPLVRPTAVGPSRSCTTSRPRPAIITSYAITVGQRRSGARSQVLGTGRLRRQVSGHGLGCGLGAARYSYEPEFQQPLSDQDLHLR